jgi:hypothetical protein
MVVDTTEIPIYMLPKKHDHVRHQEPPVGAVRQRVEAVKLGCAVFFREIATGFQIDFCPIAPPSCVRSLEIGFGKVLVRRD